MKSKITFTALLLCIALAHPGIKAQDNTATLLLQIGYYNNSNKLVNVEVKALEKKDGKLQTVKGLPVTLYLQDTAAANRIAAVITNEQGKASATIPPALQNSWQQSNPLTFIAISRPYNHFESKTTSIDITKSRLLLDTTVAGDGSRTVVATFEEYSNDTFKAVKDVDIRIGVQRMGASLPIGDNATYTTDSAGKATATYSLTDLPGDSKGNLTLVAAVENNDTYGNITVTHAAPWGVAKTNDDFGYGRRAMWATNNKAPLPLQLTAYTLIVLVWGILLYLVFQLVKIKRLGKAES